jgi:alpha-tubulin suppressor-like RCC1 family protein
LSFVHLTTGERHSCGRTASGTAYCWGNNAVGQLGDGSVLQSSVPIATLPFP